MSRDDLEALVHRLSRGRLDPREVACILRAADDYRATARYRDQVRPCGTPAAYRRHLRRNEPPCEDCLRSVRPAAALRSAAA